MTFAARAAKMDDAPAIMEIYNEGIADRVATFETEPRLPEQIKAWFDGRHPIVVVEDTDDSIATFASASSYRGRAC